jgi:hypothetical protein
MKKQNTSLHFDVVTVKSGSAGHPYFWDHDSIFDITNKSQTPVSVTLESVWAEISYNTVP